MAVMQHESSYTRAISELINQVEHPLTKYDSLIQDAVNYFAVAEQQQKTMAEFDAKQQELEGQLNQAANAKRKTLESSLQGLERTAKEEARVQKEERLERLDRAIQVCQQILELSEGNDAEETLQKSAKYLGTILLMSPGEGNKLPEIHQRFKPAYKAVLSIRLLDALMQEKLVENKYLLTHYDEAKRFSYDREAPNAFIDTVVYPFMFAAIFQDIGMYHPAAQRILRGPDGDKDPFRLLPAEERKTLLKLTYQHTMDYLENGLGMRQYVGNSREERDMFDQQQLKAVTFIKALIKDTLQPKLGFGEIIKVPQIYTSVVLSTKRDYKASDLPKACLLIEQLAEKGSLNKQVVNQFVKLMGHFPQGFGVTYIPISDQGFEMDRYEYAIVNCLCPSNPYEPICRVVTRNLTYISSGQTLTIKKPMNLHFPMARKKLAKVDKEKLQDILRKLMHEFDMEAVENLIPSFWLPYEYFSDRKNQNLWSKAY